MQRPYQKTWGIKKVACATWVPGHSPARRRRTTSLLEQRRHALVRVGESNRLGEQLPHAEHVQLRELARIRNLDGVRDRDLRDRRARQSFHCRTGEQGMRRADIDVLRA